MDPGLSRQKEPREEGRRSWRSKIYVVTTLMALQVLEVVWPLTLG